METESAWKAGHQHELSRLKADASRRKFDAVLVWALDRLSREGALTILQLVSTFKVYGVKVLSYQESWTEVRGNLRRSCLPSPAGWLTWRASGVRNGLKPGWPGSKLRAKSLVVPRGRKTGEKEDAYSARCSKIEQSIISTS
jgi:hypothetical protein